LKESLGVDRLEDGEEEEVEEEDDELVITEE